MGEQQARQPRRPLSWSGPVPPALTLPLGLAGGPSRHRTSKGLELVYFSYRGSWPGIDDCLWLRARSKDRDTQGPEPLPYPRHRQQDPQEGGGSRQALWLRFSEPPPEVPKPEAHCQALRTLCGASKNKILGNCSSAPKGPVLWKLEPSKYRLRMPGATLSLPDTFPPTSIPNPSPHSRSSPWFFRHKTNSV